MTPSASKLMFVSVGPADGIETRTACRAFGCHAQACDLLGFCGECLDAYLLRMARRACVVEGLRRRLTAIDDPVFCAFGPRRGRELAAHVLAHLEVTGARSLHVPDAAVDDYVSELDERADQEPWR